MACLAFEGRLAGAIQLHVEHVVSIHTIIEVYSQLDLQFKYAWAYWPEAQNAYLLYSSRVNLADLHCSKQLITHSTVID